MERPNPLTLTIRDLRNAVCWTPCNRHAGFIGKFIFLYILLQLSSQKQPPCAFRHA